MMKEHILRGETVVIEPHNIIRQMHVNSQAGWKKKKKWSCFRGRERVFMSMGMVLTRTHFYVADFGLNLRPSTSHSLASVPTLPGSCPGPPPTGHGAQTPWRPLLPQPMHCKHPQTRHDTHTHTIHTYNMGMRNDRGREERGVEHPIAGKRVREWEKREIKWAWAHSLKKQKHDVGDLLSSREHSKHTDRPSMMQNLPYMLWKNGG